MADWGTAALGLSGITLAGLLALASRFAKLELKVDTMWEFQLRRGIVEGKLADILQQNSPIRLDHKLLAALEPMKEELQAFYTNGASKMSEIEEAVEIERRFGAQIVKQICLPLAVSHGVCVVAAMVYGRSLVEKTNKKTVFQSGSHKVA